MIKFKLKDKEVEIEVEYIHELGSKPRVHIEASGDLSHHLIEGLFNAVDKLARMENCSHRKEEYGR